MRLHFVSIMTICLFDCLEEGIARLFVFGHVSGRLAMIKSGGSRFKFCVNAAINPLFLVREGFNCHSGYISDALANRSPSQRIHQCCCMTLSGSYPSPCDRRNLEAWNLIGQTSIEHGRFLF